MWGRAAARTRGMAEYYRGLAGGRGPLALSVRTASPRAGLRAHRGGPRAHGRRGAGTQGCAPVERRLSAAPPCAPGVVCLTSEHSESALVTIARISAASCLTSSLASLPRGRCCGWLKPRRSSARIYPNTRPAWSGGLSYFRRRRRPVVSRLWRGRAILEAVSAGEHTAAWLRPRRAATAAGCGGGLENPTPSDCGAHRR